MIKLSSFAVFALVSIAVPALASDSIVDAGPGQGQGPQKDKDQKDGDQKDKDQKDRDQKDRDQKDKDQKDKDQKDRDQKDRDQKDKDQKDKDQRDRHQRDKDQAGDQDDKHKDKDKDKHDGHKGKDHRLAHFNLVCYYRQPTNPQGFQNCKAAASFKKHVTLDGGEIADESPDPSRPLSAEIPFFKVECDNVSVYGGDRGRRFTDLLSTRIQALTGPKPAIYLPRGSLHVGQHISDSYLEIDTGLPDNDSLRTVGKCYIWTGAP